MSGSPQRALSGLAKWVAKKPKKRPIKKTPKTKIKQSAEKIASKRYNKIIKRSKI